MTRTILVADDSPTMQRRASSLLIAEGLEVVTVSNGVAAIKKLPTVRPHLILADVSMPGKDGYEVCEFVKNSAEMSHIPVLLIFSELEPYQVDRGERVHADGCVKKPFDHEVLIATVSKFLARAELPESAVPHPAPVSAEFESGELAETTPEPEAQPEFNLAALSEGVALTEPSNESAQGTSTPEGQAEISELDSQIFQSRAEDAPIPVQDGSGGGGGFTSDVEKPAEISAISEPNGGGVQSDSEAATSEAETIFRASPEMAAQTEGSAAVQFQEPKPEPEEPEITSALSVDEADGQKACVQTDAASEDPGINMQEFVAEPELAKVPSVMEFPAAAEPEPSGLEADAAQATEGSREVPAPAAEYRFDAVENPSGPVSEGEQSKQISDLSQPQDPQVSSAFQAGLVESEFEIDKKPPLTVEEVKHEVARAEKLDPQVVSTIVRKVVLKMSPPALGAEVLEDITRQITSELTAELDSNSS